MMEMHHVASETSTPPAIILQAALLRIPRAALG
jgi:hypothetical protein